MSTLEPHDVSTLATADRLTSARWRELWIDGDPTALSAPLVAIVGTRDADPVGLALTRAMAAELARRDVRVLSGGALGIDAAAHRGALLGRGRTVVVLPSGLEHWYPKRHEALYKQVIAGGGALVSQFPPETPPTQWTFPRRNELVASLADVMVVVQAPIDSGALLAAECARRLGRRVMAVPAAPGDRRGAGCVQLLRAGALPCTCADDVLAALDAREGPLGRWAQENLATRRPRRSRAKSPSDAVKRAVEPRERAHESEELLADSAGECDLSASLDAEGRLVYESLSVVARHVDELTRLTGLAAASVQRSLLTLVLAGLVSDRGGGKYVRG
ncbi:MAG: DNA-processing protein DprA [Polyangiales bacterium]